jgi:hypothetical protein
MSKIIVNRKWFSTKTTMGVLQVPDAGFECYTLEDVARPLGVKIYGETAIPQGKHKFILSVSSRFKMVLPLIYNTSGYVLTDGYGAAWTGIRIHAGNTQEDSSGCIIVGYKRGENMVYESKKCLQDLMAVLSQHYGDGKEYPIQINNNQTSISLYA